MQVIGYLNNKKHLKSFILLFLIAIFMLDANPFKSETVAPMGLIQSREGWKNIDINISHYHPERGDILDAKLPRWIEAKHHLYNGELPVWNHVTAGGYPSLFMFTESLATPAFFIFALIKNDATGFYFSNLINILIGLIGMYLFLRIFFNPYASFFGAIVFMFSGFNTAWFFWPHVNTSIWTPWVFFTVYKYMSTGKLHYLPFVTLSMTFLNLGGFPLVAVMTYMALAIMLLTFITFQRLYLIILLKKLFLLGLFSIFSITISLPFLYPIVEMFSWMGGIGYRNGGGNLPLNDLKLFVMPYLYNLPRVEKTLYVGILPVIFLFISIYIYNKRPNPAAKFSLMLFIFSISITFALVSPDLIRMIPTLDTNLWSRFSFLVGTSLAILSAYVISQINIKKPIYLISIISMLAYQIYDQKGLFNSFNSPVPNNSFYPQTDTISYLQKNLQPLQYVLADAGYLNAGTLGSYGIPEWYSHGFHSPKEKEILTQLVKNPFHGPTSAGFLCSQIQLNSPYMHYLNNKYIACSMGTEHRIELWNNKIGFEPSPVLQKNKLIQPFTLEKKKSINAIQLYIATHGHKHPSSDIEITLYKDNKVIVKSLVKKENITDYTWVRFSFKDSINVEPGKYSLSIMMTDTKNAENFSLWCNTNAKKSPMVVNGEKTNLTLKMRLLEDNIIPKTYKIVKKEPNIIILENTQVKGGAYFLNSLQDNQPISYDGINTKITSNKSFQIDYQGSKKGWIILPIRYYPGWSASVNGDKIEIEMFLNMLPAIKVDKKSKIIVQYNPRYRNYTYWLSILSLIVILLTIWKFKRRIYL